MTTEPTLEEVCDLVVRQQLGAASFVSRKLGCGFRAAFERLDQLEALGIVGPAFGSRARDVLTTDLDEARYAVASGVPMQAAESA